MVIEYEAPAEDVIDATIGEIETAECAAHEAMLTAPSIAEQRQHAARYRLLGARRHEISVSRQIVAQIERRIESVEARRKQSARALKSFEQELARLRALPDDPLADIRRHAEAEALLSAIALLRDGRWDGRTTPGPIIGWCREHRIDGGTLPALPSIDALITDERRRLAPHRERLAAAIAVWQAETRPPAA
jgi:hypothetical protein